VKVMVVARAQGAQHAATALYCANDFLVLLLQAEGRSAVVRHVPWFNDANCRVVAMAFDSAAARLLCVAANGGLHVVPVLSLLHPAGIEADGAGGEVRPPPSPRSAAGRTSSYPLLQPPGVAPSSSSQHLPPPSQQQQQQQPAGEPSAADGQGAGPVDIRSIAPLRVLARTATCCAWWEPPPDGVGPLDVALVGTKSSTLIFVNLRSGAVCEKLTVPGRSAVTKIKLVRGLFGDRAHHRSEVHALLQADATHSAVLLQHKVANAEGEVHVEHILSPGRRGSTFSPLKATWKSRAPVALHRSEMGAMLICVRMRGHVHVFTGLNDPVRAYARPEGTRMLSSTKHLMFCVSLPDTSKTEHAQVHAVSFVLAANADSGAIDPVSSALFFFSFFFNSRPACRK
jgi:hypothetical protein